MLNQLIMKQCFGLFAVTTQHVEHKTLKIRRFGNIHGWTGGFMRIGTDSYPVDASAKELVQHIVFIGGDHQLVNRQSHHARHMAGTNIAKITRRHGKADFLLVGTSGLKITCEVVNHLRHQARPVNGVNRANFVVAFKYQVIGDCFNNVLAVIEHSINGDVVNVFILQAEHLSLLEWAHASVGAQHKDANALFAPHGIFSSAAGVATGSAQNIQFFAASG